VAQTLRRGLDSAFIRIDARHVATRLLGQITRRTTRATRNFEHVLAGFQSQPGDEAIVFAGSEPTVLADVAAESLFADRGQHQLGKVTVTAVKVNAL